MTSRRLHAALFLLSALTITIALGSQYIGGLEPCDLCYKQRWPYYLALPCIVLAWRPSFTAPLIALTGLIFACGAGLAAYHAGVEYGWWPGPSSCASGGMIMSLEGLEQALAKPVIRCDAPAFTLFGVSMAGYNFIISVILTSISVALLRSILRPQSE